MTGAPRAQAAQAGWTNSIEPLVDERLVLSPHRAMAGAIVSLTTWLRSVGVNPESGAREESISVVMTTTRSRLGTTSISWPPNPMAWYAGSPSASVTHHS